MLSALDVKRWSTDRVDPLKEASQWWRGDTAIVLYSGRLASDSQSVEVKKALSLFCDVKELRGRDLPFHPHVQALNPRRHITRGDA